jgi:hypothetical protein
MQTFLLVTFGSGLAALIVSFLFPSEAKSHQIWAYSYTRIAVAIGMLILLALLFILILNTLREKPFSRRVLGWVDSQMASENIAVKARILQIITCLFLVELFLLLFIADPPFLRLFFAWLFVVVAAAWATLRLSYPACFSEKRVLLHQIKNSWRGLLPVQRKTFYALTVLGLLYFLAFIPLNLLPEDPRTMSPFSGIDEVIQYKGVTEPLLPGEDFSSTVKKILIHETIYWEHPFVLISASTLLLPRILFNIDFVNHVQLNMLILRQLITVLPFVLSMFLLVWIVTRFKSILKSVSMFILLLSIPGVVYLNVRFHRPDSLLVLFIILTFFFLQKDDLSLGFNFYMAAFACGIAVAVKIWGFFFFLPVLVYLLTSLARKSGDFGKHFRAGVGFIIVMVMAVFLSSPALMIPQVLKGEVAVILSEQNNRILENSQVDPEGVYVKGFSNWMRYFEMSYMRDYYFFFCFIVLGFSSIVGSEKLLGRLLLMWCLSTALFLIFIVAIKSPWYMLPLMVPLYVSPFLLPAALKTSPTSRLYNLFHHPVARFVVWIVIIGLCGSQFIFNLIKVIGYTQ